MRKLIILAVLVLALIALAIPAALAEHNVGPCNDSGEPGNSDYAQHHIVPADLGSGGHIPGNHRGFSACIPQAGWK